MNAKYNANKKTSGTILIFIMKGIAAPSTASKYKYLGETPCPVMLRQNGNKAEQRLNQHLVIYHRKT